MPANSQLIVHQPHAVLERPLPEEIVRKYAETFAEVRDYMPSSRHRVLNWIRQWYNDGQPDGIEYRKYLLEHRGLARNTISSMFGILRRFGEFLVANGVLAYNPFQNTVIRTRGFQQTRRPLEKDELHRLLVYARDNCHERERAIIGLMAGTGIRCQAIVRLNFNNYEPLHDPAVLNVQHKGHWTADSFVYIYPTLRGLLDAWLDIRPGLQADNSPFFVTMKNPHRRLAGRTVRQRIRRIIMAAGISATPHQLRHTAITIAREAGTPLDAVREMAGHASIKSTEVYDHAIQRKRFAPEKVLDGVLADGICKNRTAEEGSGTRI